LYHSTINNNWVADSIAQVDLNGIYGVSARDIYVVGTQGVILHGY
jgi:hypothetical protein